MVKDAWLWLALQRLPDTGPATLNRLLLRFGSPTRLLGASVSELLEAGLPGVAASRVASLQRKGMHSDEGRRASADLECLRKLGARLLIRGSPDYPALLEAIHQPPPLIYALGSLTALDGPMIAIVGSRRASAAGRQFAAGLAAELAEAGLGICSGLALGIDAAAHEGGLSAAARSAVVTGVGIDRVYPRRHAQLQQRLLAAGGLVLSEFALQTDPLPGNFPRRNRLISGLCLGVVVVEAAQRSGSLITARFALEQGREVFAVPGSVRNPYSRGCHALLRDGACLVESAEDVLAELNGFSSSSQVSRSWQAPASLPGGVDAAARSLWAVLDDAPASVDDLGARCRLAPGPLLAAITDLEMLGLIECRDGGYQRR